MRPVGLPASSAVLADGEPWLAPAALDSKLLYDENVGAVLAYCKRLLGSSAAGEDATQEVFVRALRHSERLPTAIELRPWLFRIATNYCLNELRRRRVRAHCPPQFAMMLTSNLEDHLMARSEMAQLLQRLPRRARDVARLTYVEGLRQQEVAEALGVSRRTVVNYLTQVRSCFRSCHDGDPVDSHARRDPAPATNRSLASPTSAP
jgi:RNA polymerase sigma-70 factor, ECF subfamily